MPYQRLDIIYKNLSKIPKLNMTINSKVLLAIILLTEYGYMILNEKKSHTVTSLVQNGLNHFRFIHPVRNCESEILRKFSGTLFRIFQALYSGKSPIFKPF